MSNLTAELQDLAECAAASLGAWQVFEELASQPRAAMGGRALVSATGLDVDVTLTALAVLGERGLVVRYGEEIMIVAHKVLAARALCARVSADPRLRQAVLNMALRRERGTAVLRLTVARAARPWPTARPAS